MKTFKIKLSIPMFFVFVFIMLMLPISISAQAAPLCFPVPPMNTLAFIAPSTNTDLSPLTDLAGFKLYYSQTSGTEGTGTVKDVAMDGATGPGTTGSIALNSLGLLDGKTYYFELSAYDASGLESSLSNEISCTYDATVPKAPGNILIK